MSQHNHNPPKEVDNKVLNAMWHAIFDILDKDGTRSIFMYANLPQLAQGVLKEGKSKLSKLLRTLHAMKDLLKYSPRILLEIGKKFSFYLDPTGSDLEDFMKMLNESMVATKFSCERLNDNALIIEMSTDVEDRTKSLLEDDWLIYFYQGIFTEAVLKGVGGSIEIELISQTYNSCKFKIQLATQAVNNP